MHDRERMRMIDRFSNNPSVTATAPVTDRFLLKVLRPLRSATVTIGAQQVTAQPRIPAEARTLLNDLGWSGH